jgi:TfoX/Sxy family transcriptional regulator of competence genes
MTRDKGLEEILNNDLRAEPGITEKAMFGGWAWFFNGNLLCGVRDDGMLVRLGKNNDHWALQLPGAVPMVSRARPAYAQLGTSHAGSLWR